MKELIELLNTYGIYLDDSATGLVKMGLFYLVLSVISLLSVINIIIYLLSIFILTNEKFLNLIPNKYTYIHKTLLFYKNIRISFIVLEFIFLVLSLLNMFKLSYNIVSFYIYFKRS